MSKDDAITFFFQADKEAYDLSAFENERLRRKLAEKADKIKKLNKMYNELSKVAEDQLLTIIDISSEDFKHAETIYGRERWRWPHGSVQVQETTRYDRSIYCQD